MNSCSSLFVYVKNQLYKEVASIDISLYRSTLFPLKLQQFNHYGFLYTFTSKYTRKHMRLMNFYKTFTINHSIEWISDSIRLVSKPFIYFSFKLRYYLNSFYLLIFQLLNYEDARSFQICHYIYQYQNSLNYLQYSLLKTQNTYLFEFLFHQNHSIFAYGFLYNKNWPFGQF